MAQSTESTTSSGLDPASFSSVIRPQDDLFRFVNGPWIDTYSLPEDRSRFGSFDKLAEDAEAQIHEILEDPESSAVKSALLYRSFLNTEAIEAAGMEPIRPDLQAIDAVPDKKALTSLLGRLNPTGGPDLFGIAIYGDPGNAGINVAHVEQAGLGLPDEAYYREKSYAPVRQAYTDMVASLLRLSGYADDQDYARRQAESFLEIETRIAARHWDNVSTRDEDRTYNPTTLADLESTLADFDLHTWIESWQKAYAASPVANLQPVDLSTALSRTIVHEPSFLRGLNELWKISDLEDLKLWARVHTLIEWAGLLSSDFDQARFDFYGKVLSGTTKMRDRWKRAVSLVNGICGEEVGREYVRRHFPASSKARMEALVSDLIDAYRVSITSSDWLGEQTKVKALSKLDKFSPKIGYTEHWRDYTALAVDEKLGLVDNVRRANLYESGYQFGKAGQPVDKEEWLMNPQTVNAYYEPTLNVIVFPAAILQPPFFDPEADDAVNYGGIGSVIGHEIGHGFDDQGSKYDGDGRLQDWWTPQDRENFEQRTKALIEQYNGFVPQQLAEKYADKPEQAPHVNGALTIGENIGDLGGVNIAIKAYALSLQKKKKKKEDAAGTDDAAMGQALASAPVMDSYTGLQRFFLSYASIWRTKNRDQLAEQYLQIDPHSPAEFRTNGIVRNVDRFYQAFGVTADDGMWLEPEARVKIW